MNWLHLNFLIAMILEMDLKIIKLSTPKTMQ